MSQTIRTLGVGLIITAGLVQDNLKLFNHAPFNLVTGIHLAVFAGIGFLSAGIVWPFLEELLLFFLGIPMKLIQYFFNREDAVHKSGFNGSTFHNAKNS